MKAPVINQEFFEYIKPFLLKLKEIAGEDFVIFGSAPLYLLNVVKFDGHINDLDISVKEISQSIVDRGKEILFYNDPNQKFYQFEIDGMKIDVASMWPAYEPYFSEIFDNPICVDGFKFTNLDVVEGFKKDMAEKYDRQKDKDYLQKIADFRLNNSL